VFHSIYIFGLLFRVIDQKPPRSLLLSGPIIKQSLQSVLFCNQMYVKRKIYKLLQIVATLTYQTIFIILN